MRTFKTEIHPTAKQQEYIRKACGIRRWTWNWAVATYFAEAKKDNFLDGFKLKKLLNNTLVKDEKYYWLSEVNSMVRAECFADFQQSLQAYAKARYSAKRTVEELPVDKYKPKFKKKGKCTESFRIAKKRRHRIQSPLGSRLLSRNYERTETHAYTPIRISRVFDVRRHQNLHFQHERRKVLHFNHV